MNKIHRSLLSICLTGICGIPRLSAQEYPESPSFSNFSQQLTYYQEGLAISDSILHYRNKCEKRMEIGSYLDRQGKQQAARYWYHLALQAEDADQQQIGAIYNDLAITYTQQGNHLQAINYGLKAIQSADNKRDRAKFQINVADAYTHIFDYGQAIRMLDEGMQSLEGKDSTWMAIGTGMKGSIFNQQKKLKQSLTAYLEAYGYVANKQSSSFQNPFERRNVVTVRNILLNNIAGVYLKFEQADSMLHYLSKTKGDWPQLSKYIKSGLYMTYGEAYRLRSDYSRAFEYYHKGLTLSEPSKLTMVSRTAYKGLAELYGQTGNYQKAWEYQKRYQDLYEESISEDNIHKIGQLHTRYALEKKDKEMAQKELQYNKRQLALQRRNNQLYLWIVSIGLSVLIIGILLRNQYNKNRFLKLQLKNAANENLLNQVQASLRGEETERERIARELHDHVMSELMATQLNLKDIEHYHPELKASSRYENILIQMEETTELLRRTTHNMMPVGLKETGLATTIEAFLYRVSNHQLMISFQCFGEKKKLADSTEKILLSITHELVQNVVKHAHATEALVQLNYYSDSLSLTVEDNGVGMPKQEETNDDGLGWHNIRRNVAALSGTVDIQSSEQEGTTVLIEIPL